MLRTTKPDSKTAHTPGPWQCSPYNKADSLYAVYDADGNELTYDDDEHEANARLIAAAPELLQALKGLLAEIEDYQRINNLGGESNHWQVISRAALSKAEGSAQ